MKTITMGTTNPVKIAQVRDVFGSVARGDDRPDSDVDLLVELGPGPMGLIEYIGFIHKLEDILGKKVDLVTEGNINKHLEPYIRPDIKKIYEERR